MLSKGPQYERVGIMNFGYLDAGTGSVVISAIAGMFAAGFVAIKVGIGRFGSKFKSKGSDKN
ncbi:MAG: hypothetical protein WCG37_04090 [Actinomycetes bacterium]